VAITTYSGWLNNGKPAYSAHPIDDLGRTLHGHGYNVGGLATLGLGDLRHLQATPPEDHTPYSNTPWPGPHPYPYVLAIDIMTPVPSGKPSLAQLGQRIFDAKQANHPGARWIKYMNWTDAAKRVWHDSWKPNHTRSSSTDAGHIHLSGRTDYYAYNGAAGWDPVAEIMGEELDNKEIISTVTVGIDSSGFIQATDPGYWHQGLGDGRYTIKSLSERLDALTTKVDAISIGGVNINDLAAALAPLLPSGLTADQVRAIVDEENDEQSRGGADDDSPAGP